MSRRVYAASAIIEARPADVYHVLADYRESHPQIVPPEFLRDLEVEEGGYGAGTVIRYRTVVFGIEQKCRAVISEPEPGRVLRETVSPTDFVTTFTVTPVDNGNRTHLEIATTWQKARNAREAFEQFFYPYIMSRMYRKELRIIASFMARTYPTNTMV